nr:DNA-directed RNA polymerase subunit beta [Lacticaseibacillus kribbianus]
MKHLLVLVVLVIVALVVGGMIGYAIGGGSPWQVLEPSTWSHILDFLR